MHFSTFVPALLALATPAFGAALSPRAAECSLKTTTTSVAAVPLATLSGPFLLKTKSSNTEYNGRYGVLNVKILPDESNGLVIAFDKETTSKAQEFYLMGSELVYVTNDTITAAYEPYVDNSTRKEAYVLVGPEPEAGVTNIACALDKSSCELKCTGTDAANYTCLANPGYEPDWRIVPTKKDTSKTCVPFVPVVVPS